MVKNIQNKVSVTVLLCYFDGENGSEMKYIYYLCKFMSKFFFNKDFFCLTGNIQLSPGFQVNCDQKTVKTVKKNLVTLLDS